MPGFYRELAADYHLFFPARRAQLDFLAKLAGDPPARLIDVASGTGEYAAALSDMRYEAFGVEIDITMQRSARARHPQIAHRLVQGDMRELLDDVRGPARLVFCIGNSLPHLPGLDDLAVALTQMYQITRPEGAVALQVVNFDRVLNSAVDHAGSKGFDLPTISATRADGARIELERRYEIPKRRAGDETDEHPQRLIFQSVFHRPEGPVQNSVNLLVITRERLSAALPQGAGVTWHGDFEGAEWTPESPATIAVLS